MVAGTLLLSALVLSAAQPSVSGVSVFPFRYLQGALGPDAMAPGAPGLWNSIAGPDAQDGALVIVRLTAPSYGGAAGPRGYWVRLVARERTRVLLSETRPTGAIGEDGRVSTAFWIRPGGCQPIDFAVTLITSARPVAVLHTSLGLSCGE